MTCNYKLEFMEIRRGEYIEVGHTVPVWFEDPTRAKLIYAEKGNSSEHLVLWYLVKVT